MIYARAEKNIIVDVIVSDRPIKGWMECKTTIGIGYTLIDGEYRPEKPFDSWYWKGEWLPPVEKPEKGLWTWVEEKQYWAEVYNEGGDFVYKETKK